MEGISVLLIEDNKDDEWLTLRVLRKLGLHDVTVARDGMTALSLLIGDQKCERRIVPDLIILDLRLPKIDGLDVLRKIRTDDQIRDTKVLVLTSSEDPHDMDVCKKLGVLEFSSKPLEERTLRGLDLAGMRPLPR